MSIICYFVNLESFAGIPSKDTKKITRKRGKKITPKTGKKITPKAGKKITPKAGKKITPKTGKKITPKTGKKITPKTGKRRNKIGGKKGGKKQSKTRGGEDAALVSQVSQVAPAIKNTLILSELTRPTYNKTDTNMPERTVKVPKTKLRLSDDKSSYNDNGTGKNIEDDTKILRCWKNELIANIKEIDNHYEFKCYDVSYNPTNKRDPSDWNCQVNNNWTKPGEPNSISVYRKNSAGFVEGGSTSNGGGFAKYKTIDECKTIIDADKNIIDANKKILFPASYTCNDSWNPNYGVNKYHWCTLNYETLTDLDTKGKI